MGNRGVDWVRYVLASPFAVIVHGGEAYRGDRPRSSTWRWTRRTSRAGQWAHGSFRVEPFAGPADSALPPDEGVVTPTGEMKR